MADLSNYGEPQLSLGCNFSTEFRAESPSTFGMTDDTEVNMTGLIGLDKVNTDLEFRAESPFTFGMTDDPGENAKDPMEIDPISPFDFGSSLPNLGLEDTPFLSTPTEGPDSGVVDDKLHYRPASPFLLGKSNPSEEVAEIVHRHHLVASPQPDGQLSEKECQAHALEIWFLRYSYLYRPPVYSDGIVNVTQDLRDRVLCKTVDPEETTFDAFENSLNAGWLKEHKLSHGKV